MVDVADQGDRIETREDLGDDDAAVFAYWQAQEAIAEREEKDWTKQGRKIVQRYRDERTEATQGATRFNILWSNVQTLVPTLYGRTPKPDVERRFKDNDPTARLAAILMERSLSYSLDTFDFDEVMESCVQDRLLPGRGVARVLYVPHFGDEIKEPQLESDDSTNEQVDEFEEEEAAPSVIDNVGDEGPTDDSDEAGEPLRQVDFEEARFVYTYWEDYREGPARTWPEVPWVRFRSYLIRDELVKRFGKKKGGMVNLDYVPKGSPTEQTTKNKPPPDLYKKAEIHEIWDKTRGEVIWLAPGTPDLILDKRPDPLRLPDFFPNPDPLRATTTTSKRVPVADYIEYQDQARELDRLTARIDKLTRALKVSGVYRGDEKQVLQQLVDEGTENRLIPVGDSQAWADNGGIKGIIEWMPIQQIAETLIQLYNARDRVKAILYELTGIGDIMRGMTEPDETLGAQKLKANFSTRRITPQQKKVAKFAKNALRLMAAVITEHFSAKTISLMTGYPQLDPVPPLPPKPVPPQLMLPAPAVSPVPPQAQAPPAGAPASPPGQGVAVSGGAPTQAPPNPAMQQYQQALAQWTQLQQAAMQVQQANQKKQQEFDAAYQLIKQDGIHGFRIDIEADSTIAIDEVEDQANRTEFLRSFIPLMEQMTPIAMGNPALAALAKGLVLFGVRGFREARTLEETISTAFDTLAKMPPPQGQGAGGPDSPADLAVRTKQVDADVQKTNVQLQIAREKNALTAAKMGQDAELETARIASEEAGERAKHGLDIARAADESAFRSARAENLASRSASRLS